MGIKNNQNQLLLSLQMACKANNTKEIIYKSEWIGYLPFAMSHWIEIKKKEIDTNTESLKDDLVLLENLKYIKKIKEVKPPGFEEDIHIYYELSNI